MIKFDLSHRSTTEIVVLMFSAVTCLCLTVLVLGGSLMRFIWHTVDITYLAESVNQMLSTILGALIGFVSGRAYGRKEEQDKINGEKPQKPQDQL